MCAILASAYNGVWDGEEIHMSLDIISMNVRSHRNHSCFYIRNKNGSLTSRRNVCYPPAQAKSPWSHSHGKSRASLDTPHRFLHIRTHDCPTPAAQPLLTSTLTPSTAINTSTISWTNPRTRPHIETPSTAAAHSPCASNSFPSSPPSRPPSSSLTFSSHLLRLGHRYRLVRLQYSGRRAAMRRV